MNKKFLWISISITAILIVLTQLNFVFTSVAPSTNQPTPGPAIVLFLIHTIFFLLGGVLVLLKKFKKSFGIEKVQIKLFILGTIFMFLAILITNILFVLLLNTTEFVGLLPIYTLVFVGFINYAIVRHKFLDINFLVARSIAYILILIILGGGYSFYLLFFGSLLFKIPFSTKEFFFYGTILLLVAFTFQPLRKILEDITDKFLYRGYYNSEKLLKELSDIMGATIALKTLTSSTLDKMIQEMRITKGVFVLFKKDNSNIIEYVESVNYDPVPNFTIEEVTLLLQSKKTILFEDLEPGRLKDIMRNLQISLVAPLIIHDEKIGILCLGEKSSGEIYSEQDSNVIGILAPQLSVAIQNAKEYEEIKRFNITLREEVDRATKDLQEANERLKSIDRLKDEFVSLASHELRTPMSAISSYLWMLKDDTNITDRQRVYLQNTYESTQRLIRLVNDMLNVSRIESGRLVIKQKPISIEKLVDESLTELVPKAQEQNIRLEVEKPQTPLPNVFADADKIKEVVMNLVGNSLKFTPNGGKITISFSDNNDVEEVHITDTGTGIKKEDMPRLFQKFGMIEGNYLKTTPGQGTGLGLYICKGIVQLHGGSIWFQSDGENRGSTFSFSLKKA